MRKTRRSFSEHTKICSVHKVLKARHMEIPCAGLFHKIVLVRLQLKHASHARRLFPTRQGILAGMTCEKISQIFIRHARNVAKCFFRQKSLV